MLLNIIADERAEFWAFAIFIIGCSGECTVLFPGCSCLIFPGNHQHAGLLIYGSHYVVARGQVYDGQAGPFRRQTDVFVATLADDLLQLVQRADGPLTAPMEKWPYTSRPDR